MKPQTDAFTIDGELLQQILDALPVGIWVTTADGRLVANNPAGRRIWAGERWLEPGQYGEYKAWWSATGKRIEAAEWALARAVATGEVTLNEMIDIECFDGSRKTILNSALPIRDGEGRMRATIAVNQDITEFKRAQDDLLNARRQLEALSASVFRIQEDERKRLSRELHDEVGQTLTALKLALGAARRHARGALLEDLLAQADDMADTLVGDVREIARRLRPPALDDLGLVAAARWHLDRVGNASALAIRFDAGTVRRRLGDALELGVFRILQEAVTNVVRHAHARQLDITLDCDDVHLRLRVADDGQGFDPERFPGGPGHFPLGLLGMRERAAQLGGELRLRSSPGEGTTVDAIFPLQGTA